MTRFFTFFLFFLEALCWIEAFHDGTPIMVNKLELEKGAKGQEERFRHLLKKPRPSNFGILAKEREKLPPMELNYGNRHPHEQHRRLQGDSIISVPESPIDNDVDYNSTNGYKTLRIGFIASPIESLRGTSASVDAKIDSLLNTVLPNVAEAWTRHLKVIPVESVLPISPQVCFGIYDTEIPPEIVSGGFNDADLVIIASAKDTLVTSGGQSLDVCGPGTLAVATSCQLDQFDRPVVGFINFCIGNVSRRLASEPVGNGTKHLRKSITIDEGQIVDTTLIGIHEVGHVLGVDLDLYPLFRNSSTGEPLTPRASDGSVIPRAVTCLDGSTRFIRFPSESTLQLGQTPSGLLFHDMVTPHVRTVARNHFNCQSLAGARLENQPTNIGVCTGTHWDERVWFTELLGPIFSGNGDGQADVLSPLTLALMEDSGWYKVSYGAAQLSPYGHGAGCDFVNSDCIVGDKVPEFGKGTFCDTPVEFDFFTGQVSPNNPLFCDPSHTIFALCNLLDENSGVGVDLSGSIRYFSNPSLASSNAQLDFCPLPLISVGVECTNENTPAGFAAYAGESYGPSSRCINAQLETLAGGTIVRPACLPIVCDEENFQVRVGKSVCEFDGQMIDIAPNGMFECPRLASICPQLFCAGGCSGAGICNYETAPPQCECFDPSDSTNDCRGGAPVSVSPPVATPPGPGIEVPTTSPTSPKGPEGASSDAIRPFMPSSTYFASITTLFFILNNIR